MRLPISLFGQEDTLRVMCKKYPGAATDSPAGKGSSITIENLFTDKGYPCPVEVWATKRKTTWRQLLDEAVAKAIKLNLYWDIELRD